MRHTNHIGHFSPERILITAFLIWLMPMVAWPECSQQPEMNVSPTGMGMHSNNASREANKPESFNYPAERVFLQTDRDIYVAGENIHLKASLNNGTHQQHSGIIYLLLRNQAGPVATSALQLNRTSGNSLIYLHDTLPSGYYELIGFTNWMKNMDESRFFCKTLFIANRFDHSLDVLNGTQANDTGSAGEHIHGIKQQLPDNGTRTPAGTFLEDLAINHPLNAGTRENVSVSLSTKNNERLPDAFTVSVSHLETIAHPDTALSFRKSEPNPGMLQTKAKPEHYMELNEWILAGQITDSLAGAPLEGARIVLNTPGNYVNLLYTYSDKNGLFYFAMPAAYNNRELFISPASLPPGVLSQLSLWDKFEISRPFNPDMFLGPEAKTHIRKSQDIVRAQKAYNMQEVTTAAMDTVSAPLVSLYSQPVQVIYPAEYTPFNDLQEIARELVPAWRIRRSGADYRSSLVSADTHLALPGPPVYFLDGLIMFDVNPLIYLNSDMLERIEIHNLHWFFGDMEFPGIIGLFSKSGEYLRVAGELPVVRTRYEFDESDHSFSSPSHENKERNPEHPDLRQVLYWNTDVRPDNDGNAHVSFYTGDLTGDYLIRAEGVAPDGSVVSVSGVISVR